MNQTEFENAKRFVVERANTEHKEALSIPLLNRYKFLANTILELLAIGHYCNLKFPTINPPLSQAAVDELCALIESSLIAPAVMPEQPVPRPEPQPQPESPT